MSDRIMDTASSSRDRDKAPISGSFGDRRPAGRSGGGALEEARDPSLELELALEVLVGRVLEAQPALLEDLDEDLDELAVELLLRDAAQLRNGLLGADRIAVRVPRGHHVIGVSDRDHAREERDVS